MTIDIFYKSYSKDFWLLHYSLLSVTKNVAGYNNLILLIPEKEKDLFDTRVLPDRTLIYYIEEYGDGYLFQQWCKINSAKYSSADFILFADSDCIFDHHINLHHFVPEPEILYTPYEQLPDAIIWKKPTEDFIKEPVQYEFMRRNCLIFRRDTLLALLKYCPNIENIIMTSKRFSEFNAMGAFAWKYEKGKYNFVNTDNWEYERPKAIQVWSHANKDENASNLHLREYIRTLETIIKAFAI